MPLQDVSNDSSLIGWLRHAGHGHLLDNQRQFSNIPSLSPPPPPPPPRPPQMPPAMAGGYNNINPHPASFPQNDNFNSQLYNHQPSPVNFISSPTQFMAPHMNQPFDMDIENMKRDPHTRVIQRPAGNDVVYRQRVLVRYLQPPTPPVSGAIIVREKQPPPPPPDPPLVIRRAPPPPPTPPPVIIRERPPLIPPPEPTTIINKIIPPQAKPPRQVIIENYPQLPPKPQDVIIERWLPVPPQQRRILYERLPAPIINQPTRPIIIQHAQPQVRVHRQVFTESCPQLPCQPASCHTDLNQVLSQVGIHQQIHSTLPSSSLISYNPYSSLQQTYGNISQPQSNIIIVKNEQPNIISPPSYGMPLSCVCSPNSIAGLGAYGSGISTIPTIGHCAGQSTVYNVPENVSVDNVLRQLGIDPNVMQQSTDPYNAVSHVWNAASHANPPHSLNPTSAVSHVWHAASHANSPHSLDPTSAVSHVWNAASHANPPYSLDPRTAVSHVWDAAVHGGDHNQLGPSSIGHNWNNFQHNLHPQSGNAPQSSGASGVLSRLFG